jgi:hypothetical protein
MSSRSFRWKRGRRGSAFQARTDGVLPYTAASSESLVQAVEPGVEYVRYLYDSTRKWYATAETKAQLLLTVNGAFVTIIFGTLFSRNSELHADAARFSIVTWLLLSISVVALASAIACAGLCLWSMHGKVSKELAFLKVDPNSPDTYKAEALWYFGHLAHLRGPAAVNAIRKADRSFEIDALSYNVVDLARKVYRKHRWVNRGWAFMALSLITFAAAGTSFFLQTQF